MQTVGIDLSAEPKGTAIAVITWHDAYTSLSSVQVGCDDGLVLRYLHHPGGAVGVDCPLGWPDAFVDLVSRHTVGKLQVPPERMPGWRRGYVLRRTDLFVRERTGLTPLSVAADRIGHTAIRLAALMSEVGPHVDVARDGSGAIVEVYPAAALHVWGLPSRGYKGRPNVRQLDQLVDAFKNAVPWFDFGEHETLCRSSDDAFDAVICAFVARTAKSGQTVAPEDVGLAGREGWIHLPTGPLPGTPWSPVMRPSE